jgi:hypothetical protein
MPLTAARHALLLRLAQRFDQITLELAYGLGLDAVVYGFVWHAMFTALGISG